MPLSSNFIDNQPLLYPNPAKDQINLMRNRPSLFSLFDLHGKNIEVNFNQVPIGISIDISNLVPGFYLLRDEHTKEIYKFYKQ
ncbi:MAG: T9SS type A sorting domain-containing protein [Cyclobacteriaceae bacterium]